jgi:hypothetical protein
MIITDVNCECGASYRRAESNTLRGAPGQFFCSCCGGLVETWDRPSERAYRLAIAVDRLYQHPKPPPSPVKPMNMASRRPAEAEAAG